MSFRTLSYVVPVHNEESILEETVGQVVRRLRAFPGSEVVLVENGSVDRSPLLVRELARRLTGAEVAVVPTESAKGLGHAYRRGIEASTGDLVVLTAADLPFGFSDLDQVVASYAADEVVIGSKAHPETRSPTSASRRAMSTGFRLLRRALLGQRVGDSQGTFFLPGGWARRIGPHLRSGDYLVTTELALAAERSGLGLREVPVIGRAVGRPSTVRPVRDSGRMLLGLVGLRLRPVGTLEVVRGVGVEVGIGAGAGGVAAGALGAGAGDREVAQPSAHR